MVCKESGVVDVKRSKVTEGFEGGQQKVLQKAEGDIMKVWAKVWAL